MNDPTRSPTGVSSSALVRRLLTQICKAAKKHVELSDLITPLLVERYGASPNDVDCDYYIDAADYGRAHITLADLDREMADRGYPPNVERSGPAAQRDA